ncbi:hypothetical protein PROFUN_16934, partial [Planoprotostelium fungivorum]
MSIPSFISTEISSTSYCHQTLLPGIFQSHPRSHKQGCDWSKKSAALDFIRTVATDEQVSDWTSYDKAQLVSAVNAKGPAQGASPS